MDECECLRNEADRIGVQAGHLSPFAVHKVLAGCGESDWMG